MTLSVYPKMLQVDICASEMEVWTVIKASANSAFGDIGGLILIFDTMQIEPVGNQQLLIAFNELAL